VPGFEDETAYLSSIEARVSEMAARARATDEPVASAELLLAAANLILARKLEPACSRGLHGIAIIRELGLAEAGIELDLDRAEEHLAGAEAALTQAALIPRADRKGAHANERETEPQPADSRQTPEAMPPERSEDLRRQLGTLQAFAVALRAYLLPDELCKGERSTRRAASRLAPLLEETDAEVAAAAQLWHACLRAREADPTPALSVLQLALADPPPQALPYAFFARLLRCRLVAHRGGFVTALALLTQIEHRCEEWFTKRAPETREPDPTRILGYHGKEADGPGVDDTLAEEAGRDQASRGPGPARIVQDEKDREEADDGGAAEPRGNRKGTYDPGDAARAVALLETRILRDWYDDLSPAEHAAEREWCADRIQGLLDTHFGEAGRTVLRLHQAIPIVAHPPEQPRRGSP
jgi:hypothetical protein